MEDLPSGPFCVMDDKGGEDLMIKAKLSSVQSFRQIHCHRISETGGTGFGRWMQQALVRKFGS